MPTLHLLCGLPCSGKTTLAKQLEAEDRALRLSPDVWMGAIVGHGRDDKARAGIEAIQLEVARRCLELGISVILESGFWSRKERDDARAVAASVGAAAKLHWLDVPLAELQRRTIARNAALPEGSFRVEPEELAAWGDMIERPGADELDS